MSSPAPHLTSRRPPTPCLPCSTFQFETIIQSHETPVRAMTFTHNGNFLVSGDDAGNVSSRLLLLPLL